jgi:hypothetical protein
VSARAGCSSDQLKRLLEPGFDEDLALRPERALAAGAGAGCTTIGTHAKSHGGRSIWVKPIGIA